MNLRHKLYWLYITFWVFTAMASCKRDPCKGKDTKPEDRYFYIDADAKSKVPFKDKDTLIYISNLGDTAILIGREYYDTSSQKLYSAQIECEKPITGYFESLEYVYSGKNPELNLIRFRLDLHGVNYGVYETNLYTQINNTFSGNAYPGFLNDQTFYSDSTLIYGKVFFGRRSLNSSLYDSFVYNYKFGFLEIKFLGGKTWILSNKI